MDVKKKMEFSFVLESYWDMLPAEIKEYIMQLKINQQNIDQENKDRMNSLCHEIKLYGKLKSSWRLGHVKCKVDKCKRSDLKIVSYYVNKENVKCEII